VIWRDGHCLFGRLIGGKALYFVEGSLSLRSESVWQWPGRRGVLQIDLTSAFWR
jgi:hypothetical protein